LKEHWQRAGTAEAHLLVQQSHLAAWVVRVILSWVAAMAGAGALLLGQMVLVAMVVTAARAVAVVVAGRKVVQREETVQPVPEVKAAMVQAALVVV